MDLEQELLAHLKTIGLDHLETQEEVALELKKQFNLCGHITEKLLQTLAPFQIPGKTMVLSD